MHTVTTLTPTLDDRSAVTSPSAVSISSSGREVRRPQAITAVSVTNLTVAAFLGALVFVGLAATAPTPVAAIMVLLVGAVLVSAEVVCAIGMWRMQSGAVHAYAVLQGLLLAVNLVGGTFSPLQLILPAITLLVGYQYIVVGRTTPAATVEPGPQ